MSFAKYPPFCLGLNVLKIPQYLMILSRPLLLNTLSERLEHDSHDGWQACDRGQDARFDGRQVAQQCGSAGLDEIFVFGKGLETGSSGAEKTTNN